MIVSGQSPLISPLQTLPAVFVSSPSKTPKWTFSGSLESPAVIQPRVTESAMLDFSLSRQLDLGALSLSLSPL